MCVLGCYIAATCLCLCAWHAAYFILFYFFFFAFSLRLLNFLLFPHKVLDEMKINDMVV